MGPRCMGVPYSWSEDEVVEAGTGFNMAKVGWDPEEEGVATSDVADTLVGVAGSDLASMIC